MHAAHTAPVAYCPATHATDGGVDGHTGANVLGAGQALVCRAAISVDAPPAPVAPPIVHTLRPMVVISNRSVVG